MRRVLRPLPQPHAPIMRSPIPLQCTPSSVVDTLTQSGAASTLACCTRHLRLRQTSSTATATLPQMWGCSSLTPPEKQVSSNLPETPFYPSRHTSAGAEQRLRILILQESMTPVLLRRLEVAGQRHIAVLAFSGPDGVFAATTFVAARRVWVVQLSSTFARQEQDWRAFQRFLQSLRLADAAAFTGG